jgi:hypothetical protein
VYVSSKQRKTSTLAWIPNRARKERGSEAIRLCLRSAFPCGQFSSKLATRRRSGKSFSEARNLSQSYNRPFYQL